MILVKNEPISLNYTSLEQFYGINKDLNFKINPITEEFTNLSKNGIFVYKRATVYAGSKFIISIDDTFSLIVII